MNVNSQYFSKEQVEAGEMTEFLNILLKQSYGVSEYKNDIHIYAEDVGAFIIEWVNIPWDKSFGGEFKYVDEDEYIVKEYTLPDGSYIEAHSEEEFNEFLANWLSDNPGWIKNNFGMWTNEANEKSFAEEFKDKLYEWQEEKTAEHFENGIPQGE